MDNITRGFVGKNINLRKLSGSVAKNGTHFIVLFKLLITTQLDRLKVTIQEILFILAGELLSKKLVIRRVFLSVGIFCSSTENCNNDIDLH